MRLPIFVSTFVIISTLTFACTAPPDLPGPCGTGAETSARTSTISSTGAGGQGGEAGGQPCIECTSCDDGILNGGETDVDCGGSWMGQPWGDCPRCDLGQGCYEPTDCKSGYCQAESPGSQGQCSEYPECLTCEQSLTLHEREEHCSEDEASHYQALIECACDPDPFFEIPECGGNFCEGKPISPGCANALAAEFSGGCHAEYNACILD